ncbi:hypothetical protein K9B35_19340 [Sphingomonas sp. R647]|uniref:hypothetical protein n=1 Tax=Sphingomonas sp. R647 TaxID=2875233 RepID=UPI001CD57A99|nr:hypothetical protein [Sphingomonas sp. R647]MCA1200127.1 hypothetical protein [Sphingomonas sp. R647]
MSPDHADAPLLDRKRKSVARIALEMCLYGLCAALFGVTLFLAVSNHPLAHVIESGPARHALAFAILPITTSLLWPRLPFLPHLIFYAVFGAAIEIAQWQMHAGRSGELEDWLVDIAVAVFVLATVAQVREYLAQRRRGAPEQHS